VILDPRDAAEDTRQEAPPSRSTSWLRDRSLWFRERHDVLGRVYQVAVFARTMLGLHAILVNLVLVLPDATRPAIVWGASAFIAVWTVVVSVVMMRPSRRRQWVFVVDSAATFLVVVSTGFGVPPGQSELSLAGFWLCGAAIYAAIFWSTVGGILSGVFVSAALFVVPAHVSLQRAGMAFAVVLLAGCVGVLISQFRRTIVEQEEERIKVAALSERERLSRIVHDGALQVLALVEREGPALGPMGQRLATLARESESQLRVHLQDRDVTGVSREASVDLASTLDKFSSARVTISTMAGEVMVPRSTVDEIEMTLQEILTNVERHAGDDAQAWVLLDQEVHDEVILWVRDNGVGMAADQAQRASEQGRFGIRDSIVGRITAVGGSAILKSAPGAGTEWELRIPIDVE
jgi:signal transduction histidine kinase